MNQIIMKTIKEYLIESLIFHSGIELNESYGEFKENHNVSFYIADKIDKLYKKHIFKKQFKIYKDDIKDIDVYFDVLNIYYDVSDDYITGYVYKTDIEIDIYISIPHNYKFGILRKKIAHEFQHYSEDMILIGKGLRSFEDIFDAESEYGELYNRARDFNNKNIPISSKQLRRAFYILDTFEQHAFMASLCEEINQLKDRNRSLTKKLTPNEMWDIIKKTNEYNAFIELLDIFNQYKENGLSIQEEKILKHEYRVMTKKDEQNLDTIFNSLISKLKRAIKKLNETLPKKICESLNIYNYSI